jgi:hypothetical protein
MTERRMETFAEFWPFYVGEHSKPGTRALHLAGSSLALLFLTLAVARRRPAHLLAALAAGYGLAWVGHFLVEKNRPAAFRYPVWSFLGDWKMFGLACRGRLGAEIERLAEAARERADARS